MKQRFSVNYQVALFMSLTPLLKSGAPFYKDIARKVKYCGNLNDGSLSIIQFVDDRKLLSRGTFYAAQRGVTLSGWIKP